MTIASPTHNVLFSSYQLKNLTLKNRILMAPMTRNMATDDFCPTEESAHYYARRAASGLIITEGTIISLEARGCSHPPGIFNDKQVQAWKKVTKAVHANGGLIFLQLWHVGRVTHPDYINGQTPISASVTSMSGKLSRCDLEFGRSRSATEAEITTIIKQYAQAAYRAMTAGFDGIEIHGANGYLIDQFLHYDTNHRSDQYGGSKENMARFAIEVVNACGKQIGYDKVGIRLTPGTYLNQIKGDDRDADVFAYLLEQLNQLPIAYVHTGNVEDTTRYKELNNATMTEFLREHYNGTLIASGNYNISDATLGVMQKKFDLVSIGRPFLANPDLIEKITEQKPFINFEPQMLETLY